MTPPDLATLLDLAWKDTPGVFPGGKGAQQCFGFFVQRDVLQGAAFRQRQSNEPLFHVNVRSMKGKEFGCSSPHFVDTELSNDGLALVPWTLSLV